MKHIREDYNRIQDPAGLIPEDEPVFLLRGQDKLAPEILIKWGKALLEAGGSQKMANLAFEQADQMVAWQETHKSKVPDLPEVKGYVPGNSERNDNINGIHKGVREIREALNGKTIEELRETLYGQGKRLIVKPDSLIPFLNQWLTNPNDIIGVYRGEGVVRVTSDLLTYGGTNIPIKKGLFGTRVIITMSQTIIPLNLNVEVTVAYRVEEYDDVCDKLIKEEPVLEITYPKHK